MQWLLPNRTAKEMKVVNQQQGNEYPRLILDIHRLKHVVQFQQKITRNKNC